MATVTNDLTDGRVIELLENILTELQNKEPSLAKPKPAAAASKKPAGKVPLRFEDLSAFPGVTSLGGLSLASYTLKDQPDLRNTLGGTDAVTKLRSKLKSVDVDGETFYIAEGDTLLDEDQMMLYAQQRQKAEEAFRATAIIDRMGLGVTQLSDFGSRGLLGITQNGRIVRWAPGTTLTYRVARDSFTSQAKYDTVVEHMKLATDEWMATCGVAFKHLVASDTVPGTVPGGALFVVREFNAGGQFIAAAFFPNDPVNRRRVLIDPSYYSTNFDKTGVLRHELGHVLGFRHEHIRSGAPAECPGESTDDTIDLTQYDPKSVMHYFCGGLGSRELRITERDLEGSQIVYGPPLDSVDFIETGSG